MFKASFKVAEIDMSEDPKTGQRIKLKKFESVSRLKAHAVNSKHKSPCDVILDFNSDIYVINEGDRVLEDYNAFCMPGIVSACIHAKCLYLDSLQWPLPTSSMAKH